MALKVPYLPAIYRKRDEISLTRNIPSSDIEVLDQRLAIAFGPASKHKPQRKRVEGQKNIDYRGPHQRKKACAVYLQVLEEDPFIFIPFILVVSPRQCETLNVVLFRQHHSRRRIHFYSNQAWSVIRSIAAKHNFEQNQTFQSFTKSLDETKPPATGAEGQDAYVLEASDFTSIKRIFGETICNAVQCSPAQIISGKTGPLTTGVRTKVPLQRPQDTIVSISVGAGIEVAKVLFPSASHKIEYIFSTAFNSDSMPSDKDHDTRSLKSSQIGKLKEFKASQLLPFFSDLSLIRLFLFYFERCSHFCSFIHFQQRINRRHRGQPVEKMGKNELSY